MNIKVRNLNAFKNFKDFKAEILAVDNGINDGTLTDHVRIRDCLEKSLIMLRQGVSYWHKRGEYQKAKEFAESIQDVNIFLERLK